MTPLLHMARRGEAERPPLVVLLHGYGSNEEDLFGLEPAFDPRYTVVSARAPLPLGRGDYAWFPLAFSEEGPIVLDPAQAEASRQAVADFIGSCHAEYGTDPDRTLLVGFSQGAILAAAAALTRPDLVRGAAIMSGRILPESAQAAVLPSEVRYLVVHGVHDPVLPVRHARESRATLERLGLAPVYQEYPMAHHVSDESLDLVTSWADKQTFS
jgi:phospholipase/carboxylesterase